MNVKSAWGKTKVFFTKVGKKNVIIGCSILLIGCAVALNWALFGSAKKSSAPDYSVSSGMTTGNGGGTVVGTNTGGTTDEKTSSDDESYFATSQINRRRARDEAMEVLQSVADSESTNAEAKEKALADIQKIAADMENESNIESLVVSKGFEKCVAVVSGGTASIVVKGDELLDTEIAQINEIVYEQTGIMPENIKIICK